MEDRLEDSSPKYWIVGDIFLGMADYLKMYTVYCSNQELANSALDKSLAQTDKFAQWYKVWKKRKKGDIPIYHSYIYPSN